MQKILLAAAALSLVAAPAFAQNSANSTVTLTSSVAKLCGVGNHTSGGSLPFDSTHVVTLADGNGQFGGETGISLGFGNMWCNAPASVTVTASPLKAQAPVTAGDNSFTNSFDLSVSGGAMIYANGQSVTTAGADASVTGSVAHAFETGTGQYSKVNIDVLPNAGNRRAVAGTYAGSVTFTVTAN